MTREIFEDWEDERLSEFAAKSKNSLGRAVLEEKCSIRTDFQRDRDRIIHSNAFRRLMHKTQVFVEPDSDHYRTRLTHTLEVSQIARTISRSLTLNEDLTEAIALGHDLGHAPFGHEGETVLNKICPYGFEHNKQSVRLVSIIEKNGKGLNLTREVLDGVLNHRTNSMPRTMEGKVVRLSDKIAYINHDIEDSLRAGVLTSEMIPEKLVKIFGKTSRSRLNKIILDTIKNSQDKDDILMSAEVWEAFCELKKFMYENVYIKGDEHKKIEHIITTLYEYYIKNINKIPEEFLSLIYEKNEEQQKVVCDYIACMTDRFAAKCFYEICIPGNISFTI